jgi:DNA-binding response OmpR family regulator
MSRRRALVVEDAPAGRMLVSALLTQQGFAVRETGDGEAGIAAAREDDPDLILLDVGLPGIDGVETCRQIREFSSAYVLMLTAQDSELDKVVGFGAGADDYLTKPFSTPELLARVGALMRRPRIAAVPAPAEPRRFGALEVDAVGREATLDGAVLDLTRIEFDLLETLSAEPHVAFTRAQLLERVWGHTWYADDHTVEVHVSNLRRKLGEDPRAPAFVRTVRGVGYRMGPGR